MEDVGNEITYDWDHTMGLFQHGKFLLPWTPTPPALAVPWNWSSDRLAAWWTMADGCRWFFWSPETHGELTKTRRKTKENKGNVSNVGKRGSESLWSPHFRWYSLSMAHPMELYRGEWTGWSHHGYCLGIQLESVPVCLGLSNRFNHIRKLLTDWQWSDWLMVP